MKSCLTNNMLTKKFCKDGNFMVIVSRKHYCRGKLQVICIYLSTSLATNDSQVKQWPRSHNLRITIQHPMMLYFTTCLALHPSCRHVSPTKSKSLSTLQITFVLLGPTYSKVSFKSKINYTNLLSKYPASSAMFSGSAAPM